jgi:hypothetical protein
MFTHTHTDRSNSKMVYISVLMMENQLKLYSVDRWSALLLYSWWILLLCSWQTLFSSFSARLCYVLLCQSYAWCNSNYLFILFLVSRPGMVTLSVYRASDVCGDVCTVAALRSS